MLVYKNRMNPGSIFSKPGATETQMSLGDFFTLYWIWVLENFRETGII